MTKQRSDSTPLAEITHPDVIFEGLLGKIKRNNNRSSQFAVRAINWLEILHSVCRELFEAGSKDFSKRNVSHHCNSCGGPILTDQSIYKPRHRELIKAWALFAGGTTRDKNTSVKKDSVTKRSLDSSKAVPSIHPDKTLEDLVNRMLANRNSKDPVILKAIERLEILHTVCTKQFETGSRDFSMRGLGAISGPLGGPTFQDRSIYRPTNRALIEAWAEFANGYTRTPPQILREQDRKETVDYIENCFQRTNLLPSYEMIQAEGMKEFLGPGKSLSAKNNRVTSSMQLWRQSWTQQVPAQVVAACDRLFENLKRIPTVPEVVGVLKITDLGEAKALIEEIECWRKYRFAMELWSFAPTNDKTGFLWLALHPELGQWRELVIGHLNFQPEHRKSLHLALHTFFARYLLAGNVKLTPQAFLTNGYSPPDFFKFSTKERGTAASKKECVAINTFIEYVLDRGNDFVEIDNHGHRIRKAQYKNNFVSIKSGTATSRSKNPVNRRVRVGALQDPELTYLIRVNPNFEQWRVYAVNWLASTTANLGAAQTAIREIFIDYVSAEHLPSDPSTLLSAEWQRNNPVPSYRETALSTVGSRHARAHFSKAIEFIDYVLETYYSAEDDFGRRVVSGDFRNFLADQGADIPAAKGQGAHSNKEVLPSRYIRYVRELICPSGAKNFGDLKWAQRSFPAADWFQVDPEKIDKDDPDCVWRIRTIFAKGSRKQITKSKQVYEIWYPGRTIAMLLKLELPLRTYQVRMLDSGEADSWWYEGSTCGRNGRDELIYRAGQFRKSNSTLACNIGNIERHAGVFRRMPDSVSGKVFAGLFINTNKTQDRGQEQWDRGYVVPWQHGKVLYWCERLRDWQRKYNPISALVPCTALPEKVLGTKTELQKQQMGSMCFLFRDPCAAQNERTWPIANGKLVVLWIKVLEELEVICARNGHTTVDGARLQFVYEEDGGRNCGLYSLHSLRVSLITHLATEGGVEMQILSECIAGHARILMTLYYKKSGISYVSDVMECASERIKDETAEQKSWIRWVKDASLKQLEVNSATVDVSVTQAIKDAFSQGGTSLIRTNLGLCAKGGMGCASGGKIIDEDTGVVSYGATPGYPQQKNCVRCRWFMTGPAFLQALVHHWNLLHFNLGDSGHRYLETSSEITALESAMLECQRLNKVFEHHARLEQLRHSLSVIYDGNEKIAEDSLATMKLIVRCKHIIDAAADPNSDVVLLAVGGMDEVKINVSECSELEQILTTAVGSTIYVDEDAQKAVLKAGNAFDRMLIMNDKEPLFFKLSEKELPSVVLHMTSLLQAYAGSIGKAVPFIEGAERLSALGLFGASNEIINLASAGNRLNLTNIKRSKIDATTLKETPPPLQPPRIAMMRVEK